MAPQKGKQGTRGQKQIVDENQETIKFYSLMSITAVIIYNATMVLFFWNSYTTFYLFLSGAAVAVYGGCLKSMQSMAKPTYSSETGHLLDGGIDLNMEAGFAENLKDLVILTSIVQFASLISNYFWFLWLLAPVRGIYMLWINVLSPWFFTPAPEVEEKKQKKLERKAMRRH